MFRPCMPFLFVALGVPVHAQTLTRDAAVARALLANPLLASARHEVDAVAGAVLQAGVRPNPELVLDMVDTRRDTRETTAQLRQPIELGGKRQRRIDAAELGRSAATADLRAREADLRAAVATAFDDVLAAQERVRLAQASLAVAARVTDTVSRRVQAGKVSPVDATRARVAQANVRLDALKVDGELATARQALAGYWGSLTPDFSSAAGNLDALPALPLWQDLVARLGNTPALARARIEMDRRRALVGVEQSRRTPDVTVTVGMKRSQELGLNQAVFGVSIPLPLFDRNAGNVLEALRRADQAGDAWQATQLDAHQALAQAYQALATARTEAAALAGEILPGAQEAYDAAVKGFDYGKFAYVDVLDAQRTLILAQTDYLRALRDARRAAVRIDRLAGANP